MPTQPFNPLETPNGRPELVIDLNDGTQEQISIIVVHHERPEYLNICLQSIHCCSHLHNYEVIVVDNGSGKETQEYLDVLEEEGFKIVRNRENKYWSAACNQGVAIADPNSKYFIFLHADTVVLEPSWLDVLVGISTGHGAGIVGVELGHYFITKQRVDFIQEWCMLVSRACWDDVGPWPEELPLIANAFIMTFRAQMAGHKPQASGNALVHHYRQFSADPSDYERLSEEAMGKVAKLMQQSQGR